MLIAPMRCLQSTTSPPLSNPGSASHLHPEAHPRLSSFMRAAVHGFDLKRTVFLYGVAGRERTPVANMMLKMLRSADWSRFAN